MQPVDTHDIALLCTVLINIENLYASFDTLDMKPMQSMCKLLMQCREC